MIPNHVCERLSKVIMRYWTGLGYDTFTLVSGFASHGLLDVTALKRHDLFHSSNLDTPHLP